MNRETGIRGEHATLVEMNGGLVGMRVAHHVRRYVDADQWERVLMWRHHKQTIMDMAQQDIATEPSERLLRKIDKLSDVEIETAADMAIQIQAGSFREPRPCYNLEPKLPSDIAHMRYIVSFYVLKFNAEHQVFMPVHSVKHKKYGYLSYWREAQLERLDIDRIRRNDPELLEFLTELRGKCREAAAFRSAHGLTIQLSLGEELYCTIPEHSELVTSKVLAAVSTQCGETVTVDDNRVSAYVAQYLINKSVPKSWLVSNNGEELCGFHVDSDNLPAVVLPGTIAQKVQLRRLPEPMMQVDPGINTPDIW